MTGNAGERLFEAIGQIPDEMVLEAAQEQIHMDEADVQTGQNAQAGQTGIMRQKADSNKSQKRWKKSAAKLGGYLKYLPVAACLCIVLGGAGYIVNNYVHMKNSTDMNLSGSYDDADGSADGGRAETDMVMTNEAVEEDGKTTESVQDADGGGQSVQAGMLPVRYDAYDGPVFPLTATGDTQKLKVSRTIKAEIMTESAGDDLQPLLQVKDTYKIRNTSDDDKTLQIVYPFVTTLNRAYTADGEILQIRGEDPMPVAYSIGESIGAYRGADLSESASIEDYAQIFNDQKDYQEQAMTKEADWNKEVMVYTFSDIQMQEDADSRNRQAVVGITVNGEKADVLTYGFDHSFKKDDGSANHCFFIPQEQKKLLLIVTGEQEGEPEIGYYANLDCVEKIDGVQCEMSQQEMSYADALRLCGNDAVKKMREDYAQGMYDAKLPEYMDADAAFGALTMIGEEDTFYSTLMQRYQSTELREILERLFGETRVVYARATVTIPAGQSVRAVVQTQKRQHADDDKNYRYDFFSTAQSHLSMKKTAFRLNLADDWQLTVQDMGLKQAQGSVWKADLAQKAFYFSITRVSDQN